MRIALANLRYPATPDESIARAEHAIEQAGASGAKIVCFPECYVPGYRGLGFAPPSPDAIFLERADGTRPVFGGYDPIALGRGAPTPGNPQLWLIVGERLFLFHDTGSRTAFATDPAQSIADAQAKWSAVMKQLAP